MNPPGRNEDPVDALDGDGSFQLGVIGAGRMGRTHLRAIRDSRRVRVAGVVESDPGTRDRVRADGTAAYAQLDELLAATSVDGILIAVPTDQHVAVVEQVLARGIPVEDIFVAVNGATSRKPHTLPEFARTEGSRVWYPSESVSGALLFDMH